MTTEPTYLGVPDRFAAIPEKLLFDSSIPANAVRVYGVLVRHGNTPDNCFPGYDTIGDLCGISPRSVPRLLSLLEDAGWVVRVNRGLLRSNGYVVAVIPMPPEVRAKMRGDADLASRRAVPREAPRTSSATSAHQNAPKESHLNESQENETTTSSADASVTVCEQPSLIGDTPPPPAAAPGRPARFGVDWKLAKAAARGLSEAEAFALWERFDKFWGFYPGDRPKGARHEAFAEFLRLSPDDRDAACAAVRRYARYCTVTGSFSKHAARWLKKRGWEDNYDVTTPSSGGVSGRSGGSRGGSTLGEVAAALRASEPEASQVAASGRRVIEAFATPRELGR